MMTLSPDVLLGIAGGVVGGGGLGAVAATLLRGGTAGVADSGAEYPAHWPPAKEYLTGDINTATKFVSVEGSSVLGKGGIPLGRSLARWMPISAERDFFLTQGFRRWFIGKFTTPLYIPKARRLQHILIQGPTGKGKSTAFMFPFLCYDAVNQCSNVVLDVKRPELFNTFCGPYQRHGKKVLLLDPWTEHETMALEPLYRARPAQLDLLAQLICSFNSGGSEAGGNMKFFDDQAEKLLRGLLDLAQVWPKRFCNLPSVQQLVSSGGKRILQAFNAAKQGLISSDVLIGHIEVLCAATDADILGALLPSERGQGRSPAVLEALAAVDKSGHTLQHATRLVRRQWKSASARERAEKKVLLRSLAEQVNKDRAEHLERALVNLGDFFERPPETRNSTIATLANKVKPFAQPQVAAAFRRDEIDLDDVARHETLLIVGTPLGQKDTGASMLGSLVSNLVVKVLEQRPGRRQAGETDLRMHPVHMLLDEFPQISMPSIANYLATLRRYGVGFVLIYQDRGQLKKRLGEETTAVEANGLTQVTFTDMHPETAQFMADTVLGKVTIVRKQKRKVDGKNSTDEQREQVNLLRPADLRQGRLNGRARPDMGLQMGSPVPFPFQPIPYWEDGFCRRLLQMTRRLNKSASSWKFWAWKYQWSPTLRRAPYVVRRAVARTDRADPFLLTAEFLCDYKPSEAEPLSAPVLNLPDIGCTPVDTAELLSRDAGGQQPAAPAGAPAEAAVLGAERVAPKYAADFKRLIEEEIAGHSVLVSPGRLPAWTLGERLDALDEMRYLHAQHEADA